jgi:hypothetical protein
MKYALPRKRRAAHLHRKGSLRMPADYVNELAEQAFKKIAAGTGEEIVRVLTDRPQDAATLANQLNSNPELQAQVSSLASYTPSQWLLEHELVQINERRKTVDIDPVSLTGSPYDRAAASGLMGLCFSGGGIRSATFNLGILQGLAELKLLRSFDYLSTVSGGGYIHQWFAAWIKRRSFEEVEKRLVPLPETSNPGSHPEPLRWLRRYSNYLTPEKGLLTADTWVALATWLRNALLNQIILIAGLLFLVLLPHLIALPALVPRHFPAVTAFVGTIFYLSFLASYFVGRDLWTFGSPSPSGKVGIGQAKGTLGQEGVQRVIVLPLMASALLLALLFRVISTQTFGFHLALTCIASMFFLLVLALTIAFAGRAPLSYLKTHHQTAQFDNVGDFWKMPKCWVHLRFALAILGLLTACVLAAAGGAACIFGSFILIAKLWSRTGTFFSRIVLIAAPPLFLGAPLVTMLLLVGFLGRTFRDSYREWLSRLAAWIGLFMLVWTLSTGLSLLGYHIVILLWSKLWTAGVPALTGWFASTVAGLFAGKSAKSSGANSDKASSFSAIELVAVVGPYIFIAGLLLVISAMAEKILTSISPAGPLAVSATYVAILLICLLFAWRVDINEFSLHAFYRNRLTRCYLGASNIPRHPNPFTGFDDSDADVAMCDLLPAKNYLGPFPIFCTALNLTFGEDLAWQERKAASFVFTPLYSGYDVPWTAARQESNWRFNGFVRTATYAYPATGVHINTAAAISGAALSPNMGYHSSPVTAFLLTLFSVRLGWWLRNPRVLGEDGSKLGVPDCYPPASPPFSLFSLVNELLGRANDTSNYVYLSDGGHFDNMGLYELVRRRCRYIVICDSEDDIALNFEGIGMAIRKARIDFGVEVALDLHSLRRMKDSDYSGSHCVVGSVTYPEAPDNPGTVVYIKSSLTGDEPADVLNYKNQHSQFPHDSTTNQWFTESQFESYRRLGHHVAFAVFEPAGTAPLVDCTDEHDAQQRERHRDRRLQLAQLWPCAKLSDRKQYFQSLRDTWWAPTAEMDRFAAAHTTRYEELLDKARTDKSLPGFFKMMFSEDRNWKQGRSEAEIEYAVQFSSELIEFIWMVFDQLELVLPEKRDHPYARGWARIFTKWTKIDVVQDGWTRYRDSYSHGFRRFAESHCVGLPPEKPEAPASTGKG